MSLIAVEPPHTPTTPPNAGTVTNDGFFPNIDLTNLRATMRLDGTVTHERLRDAAVSAIADVNADLEAWAVRAITAGASKLEEVPAKQLDGKSINVMRYLTAVYRLARADLTERYRGFDATNAGSREAEDNEAGIGDDRRTARWAIRDILGKSRTTIELI